MKKGEFGALLAVAAVFGASCAGVLLAAGWLSTNQYANAANNLLGLLAGPSLLAAIALGAWMRWCRTCRVPWCFRLGELPVEGSTGKVCTHHDVDAHHHMTRLRHPRRY
jgi:hypothetical protein